MVKFSLLADRSFLDKIGEIVRASRQKHEHEVRKQKASERRSLPFTSWLCSATISLQMSSFSLKGSLPLKLKLYLPVTESKVHHKAHLESLLFAAFSTVCYFFISSL